jgi:arylsulfatase A
VFRAIDAAGIANNTLVIFTSDNGGYWPPDFIERYRAPLESPMARHESGHLRGGTSGALPARWPGRFPPESSAAISHA